MIIYRTLLILVLGASLGWGLPSRRAADDTADGVAATAEKDDYNPQCLPLDFFEKAQSEEVRAKREDGVVVEEAPVEGDPDEIVAQPGFFVPANRRRPCFGRNRDFTKNCGPGPRAYRVRNFVMAPPPLHAGPLPMRRKKGRGHIVKSIL